MPEKRGVNCTQPAARWQKTLPVTSAVRLYGGVSLTSAQHRSLLLLHVQNLSRHNYKRAVHVFVLRWESYRIELIRTPVCRVEPVSGHQTAGDSERVVGRTHPDTWVASSTVDAPCPEEAPGERDTRLVSDAAKQPKGTSDIRQ